LELRKERKKKASTKAKGKKKSRRKAKKKQNDKRIARGVHGLNIANSIRMAKAVTSNQSNLILIEFFCNSKENREKLLV